MWGYWRFFGLNKAQRFSSYDSDDALAMYEPGSVVNGFSRDGRVLVIMGVPGGKLARQDKLKILAPQKLGLREDTHYRLVDLRQNRYLSAGSFNTAELAQVPVTLIGAEPSILLIEPEQKRARVVYFEGADEVTTETVGRRLKLRIKATTGSPLKLHVDMVGEQYYPLTAGFARVPAPGDLAVFAGAVPADGVVTLSK